MKSMLSESVLENLSKEPPPPEIFNLPLDLIREMFIITAKNSLKQGVEIEAVLDTVINFTILWREHQP